MRYRLRTLMIVLALGPMVLAAVWYITIGNPPPAYKREIFFLMFLLAGVLTAILCRSVIYERGV